MARVVFSESAERGPATVYRDVPAQELWDLIRGCNALPIRFDPVPDDFDPLRGFRGRNAVLVEILEEDQKVGPFGDVGIYRVEDITREQIIELLERIE